MREHYLDGQVTQPYWDRSAPPRLEIESGDVVIFDCPEPCGQVTPQWTSEDLHHFDPDKVHALVGPVFVKGAQPGEVLEIEVLKLEHRGWGWSGHLPGFGLLAEQFDFAYLHHWQLRSDRCIFGVHDIIVPARPFCGCLGVAPRETGRFHTMPPRDNGGNIDSRDITVGATAWLPVFVEGALFACGDCHAAQGHGEVSGTGIESPMQVTLRLTRRADMHLQRLQYQAPANDNAINAQGDLQPANVSTPQQNFNHVTTAHGPDLMANAQQATRDMIDWLANTHDLTPSQALILCGAAADLRINQIVNQPNWLLSLALQVRRAM